MLSKRMRRGLGVAVSGLLPLTVLVALQGTASAHGYTQNPPSRSYQCAQGAVSDCGQIQWEPQSVEGPKGFPSAGPADGTLCAGGNARFAELDDPGKPWPATPLPGGQNFEFTWKLTAAHATSSFRYFVTKDGWNPNARLSRSQLEPAPFRTVDMGGERPPFTVRHSGTLPDKGGRHLIFAVWDVADTGNAFYSCADVDFG